MKSDKSPKSASKRRKRNFVKVGNIRVPWYRIADGRTVIDPPYEKRRLRTFTDHDEALTEARRIAIELNGGGVEVEAFTAEDRAAYAQATAIAREFRTDLPAAITQWREIRRMVAAEATEPDLMVALKTGLDALRRKVHLVADVAAELLAAKDKQDFDARYARDLKTHFADFSRAFPGDIAAITTAEIQTWLNARKKRGGTEELSPKRWNHIRENIVHLFKFARNRGYLPDKISAAQQVEKAKVAAQRVEVFSPAEVSILLARIDRDWLPWLAISAFSGVRSEEIAISKNAAERKDCLRWEDFDWAEHEIFIRAATAKTGKPRRIPIHANLFAWLEPWRESQAKGPVSPLGDTPGKLEVFKERFLRELSRVKSEDESRTGTSEITKRLSAWPHNALRHSYGSYRMAILRDIQQLAYEMGNSPSMIQDHYHNPRPPSEAKAWFAICPAPVAK